MIPVYFSQVSNNTTRLVTKVGLGGFRIPIIGQGEDIYEPYVLICPTYQMAGGVPHQVRNWLENNASYMQGVIATGNRNFAGDFGKAGRNIASDYGVEELFPPVEISGTTSDVLRIKELLINVRHPVS